jgi:UDP-2,3-diacylglucosamine pyrophosphatase LpxH
MRLLWLTDIHLDHIRVPDGSRIFASYLRVEQAFDAVIVTGDIAEAPTVRDHLQAFAQEIGAPVYFVLGNHDFYGGSIANVYEQIASLSEPNLVWLDRADPILIDATTALVGNQGWYDGILGKPYDSRVLMSDFQSIQDFREHFRPQEWLYYVKEGSREPLLTKLRALSAACAEEARKRLVEALKVRKDVIFATHYPPFKGACWHEGRHSNDSWMPWFTSATMGHMLDQVASEHPACRILVLCGHTHSSGVYQPKPNLRVLTGKAVYGSPEVSGLFETPFGDAWDQLGT